MLIEIRAIAFDDNELPNHLRWVVGPFRHRFTVAGMTRRRGFAGNGTVRVLLDRRVIARRARSEPYEAGLQQRDVDLALAVPEAGRQADRRLPSKVDALLRAIGWAIVPLDVPKHHHRDSALQ